MQEQQGLYDPDKPFFRFLSGRNITVKKINKMLAKIFPPTTQLKISGHSFRSGLISSAANFPDIVNDPHVKGWGRWKSNSFLRYELLDCEQKRWIFNKLTQKLKGSKY
jgi:hypothetical protein